MLIKNKIILILVILLVACEQKKSKETSEDYTLLYRKHSIGIVGEKEYEKAYSQMNDSLNNWIDSNLKIIQNLKVNTWELDSLLCFKSEGNKLIGAIKVQLSKYDDATHDGIHYIYGIKIDDKWFFFYGPYLVAPRNQQIRYVPNTFEELHNIVMKEVFRGYLKKSSTGNWEINDSFFERIEFQYEKWAYWDSDGNKIDNSTLSRDSLTKLFLKKAVYEKWKTK